MTETVFIKENAAARDTYHTDPDCPRLEVATGTIEKPLNVLYDDIEECDFCQGIHIEHATQTHEDDHMTGPGEDAFCRSCQHEKPRGEPCDWCERYEDVMGAFA